MQKPSVPIGPAYRLCTTWNTSFRLGRHGGRLLSALNNETGIGKPYCKKRQIHWMQEPI